MIIEYIFRFLLSCFDTFWFVIPELPDAIYYYIDIGLEWMSVGLGIASNYVPVGYIMLLFSVVCAVDVAIAMYHFIMWVLKKIPLISVR